MLCGNGARELLTPHHHLPPIPTRCAFTKCGVNKSSERLDELELHLHQTPANDMSELRSLLPPHALSSDLQPAQSCLWRAI